MGKRKKGGIASFLAMFLISLFVTQSANALSLTPLIGYVMPNGTLSPTTGFTTGAHSYSLCYGGWVNFKMFRTLSMETGALYLSRGFDEIAGGTPTEFSFNSVEIPLVLRYYFLPGISAGIGAYYAHGFGSYHMTTNSVTTSTDYGFATYGSDDYGVVVSLGFLLKLQSSTGLIFDVRYLYGLKNLSPATSISTTLSDLQALVGIQLGI